MSLFSGITDAYKKSEAAVVVQNLLEHQARVGLLDADPRELANRLVSLVWDAKPDMFGGKFGQRPHKLSVAAAALANGFNQFNDDLNQGALLIALGNLLTKLEINGHLYSLNVIDHTLIGAAASIFVETFGQHDTTDQPQRQSDKSNYSSFDAWYAEFKAAAGKANPRLRQTYGKSLIDFMDHKHLRRAYRDRVEPRKLAQEFARSFDIRSFAKAR